MYAAQNIENEINSYGRTFIFFFYNFISDIAIEKGNQLCTLEDLSYFCIES